MQPATQIRVWLTHARYRAAPARRDPTGASGPAASRIRRILATCRSRPGVVLLAVSATTLVVVLHLVRASSIDLRVYQVEGAAIRHHLDLYGQLSAPQGLQATYPPFAAIVFVPLTLVSATVLPAIGLAANLLLLVGVAALSCRLVGGSNSFLDRDRVCVVAAVTLWCEPVFTTLRNGQLNLLLLALILVDFGWPRSRWRGVGIGLAAGLKVTPFIFIVYLLLTRRFRAAATAGVIAMMTIAVSALLVPHDTHRYWTSALFASNRVGHVEDAANQSLFGLLARLTHTTSRGPFTMIVVGVAAVAGMACAVLACRRLGDAWGVSACAVTALLISPIAWTHHWVWVVPIVVLVWRQARAFALATVAVFWTFIVWAVPHDRVGVEFALAPWQQLLSAVYAIWGVAFLALSVRASSRANDPPLRPAAPYERPHASIPPLRRERSPGRPPSPSHTTGRLPC